MVKEQGKDPLVDFIADFANGFQRGLRSLSSRPQLWNPPVFDSDPPRQIAAFLWAPQKLTMRSISSIGTSPKLLVL